MYKTARELRAEQLEQERRALAAQKQREQEAQEAQAGATAQAIRQAGGLMGYVGRSAASSFGSAQAQNMALVLDALNGDPAARAAYEARNKELSRPPGVHANKAGPAPPTFKELLLEKVGVKARGLPTSFADTLKTKERRLVDLSQQEVMAIGGQCLTNIKNSRTLDKAAAVRNLRKEVEPWLAARQVYQRRNFNEGWRRLLVQHGFSW